MVKFHLFWNISRQYGKVSFILEMFPDNICFLTSFQQDSGQNLLNLEHLQIICKSYIYSGKVSRQNLFLDMFPDKVLDKICFRTKPGIFPDSREKISFILEKFTEFFSPNYFSDKNFRKKYVLDKIWIDSRQYGKYSFNLIRFQDKISFRIYYLTSFRSQFQKKTESRQNMEYIQIV